MKKGYSLLVVIIALVIFAFGLVSIVALLPAGHQSVKRAIFFNRAAAIAERELASIRACYSDSEGPSPPPTFRGEEPDGFHWLATIENGSDPLPGKGGDIYTVTLDVFWKEAGKEEKETFETKFIKK